MTRRRIEEIYPYPKNAKVHTKKQIKQIAGSILSFGFNQPVVIDSKGVIIVGHGRFEAAKYLGMADVPVMEVKLTDAESASYRLADNKLNESPWEMELVIDELRTLSTEMYQLTGFSMDLIVDPREKDDILPENVPARAKFGEIYALGEHRLICGDSTSPETFLKLLEENKASMTFTDPPYNVAYEGKTKQKLTIQNDEMSKQNFYLFLEKACRNIIDYTDGGIYICMSSSEIDQLKKAFESTGGHWQSFVIWVKSNFSLGRQDYQNTYEPILYGWSKRIKNHYFIDERNASNVWEELSSVKAEYDGTFTTISFQGFKIKLPGKISKGTVIKKKQRLDIFRHDKPSKSIEHPTMKPVSLAVEAICNSSQEGEIVLDPFLGSGTTLIACEKTGRKCYGIELDPLYISVILERWAQYTGEDPILVETAESTDPRKGLAWSAIKSFMPQTITKKGNTHKNTARGNVGG